jgi:hypothetical protein
MIKGRQLGLPADSAGAVSPFRTVNSPAMERAMWLIPKVMGFALGTVVIVISGMQCKNVSPHIFQYVTVTVAHFQKHGFFDHEPQGDFNFQ